MLEDEKVKEISNFFENEPKTSLRFVAKEVGCSFKTVHNIARQKINLFPYKIQMTQLLHDEDLGLRMAMCETLLEKIDADENFLDRLIFSDECTFFLNGMVNRHNCRIWARETLMETIPKTHSSPKVNVWMGLSSTRIYVPFFLPGNINGELYLDMLEKCFLPQLTRNVFSNVIFQQDGAPAHYHRKVREFLDRTFTGRWLGRCGPLVWAARSPDLTPLDFFAWGHLKTAV